MRIWVLVLLCAACSSKKDAGSDGGAGDGGSSDGGSPDGGTIQCMGRSLRADGVLDVDIRAVHLSGRVTLRGAPLPSETSSRGNLQFRHRVTGSILSIPLQSSGALSYDVRIAPGEYDILLDANESLCSGATLPQMPCVDAPLRSQVALETDGALDIDIPAVTVRGSVTLGGQPLPAESSSRGALTFARADGGQVQTRSFGTTGAASYGLVLVPGTYRIELAANAALCAGTTPPQVPCIDGVLRDAMALMADGVLDVDLPRVEIRGNVTLAGQAMPADTLSRGALQFQLDHGGQIATRDFGSTGAVSYALTLLPGMYRVSLRANDSLCQRTTPPQVPCVDGVLRAQAALTANGVLDLDLTPIQVRGSVTLGGQPLPAESGDRGALVFARDGGGSVRTRSFGTSGAASYALTLLSGTYRVELDGNETLCAGATAPHLPCIDGVLRPTVSLTQTGVLDLDVPVVQVRGAVTLAGAAMPTEPTDRGALVFRLSGGGQLRTAAFGSSGAVSYAVTLLPGTYGVDLDARTSCTQATAPRVPCIDGALKTNVSLASSGVLDVDIPAVHVGGNVTLAGQALPSLASDRGRAEFQLVHGGTTSSQSFGTSGPFAYAMTLLPGEYVVVYRRSSGACSGPMPCTDEVLAGCP